MKAFQSHCNLLLATAGQSQAADRKTIASLGIPGETLMEIAGNRAADIIASDFPNASALLFVCGKGNNAGDALVAARILLNDGYPVALYPAMGTDGFSPDAQTNFDRLMHLADEMETPIPIWNEWQDPLHYDLIVDGIFGTGLERDVKKPVSDTISRINNSGKTVYALDIPSGLHCDTGNILKTAVRADKTIQFGIKKLGCYLEDGPACSGERTLVRLPFPNIYKKEIKTRLTDESIDPLHYLKPPFTAKPDRSGSLKKRPLHKYNNGVVHVIGGSAGLTGAPLHTARAAWSLGMGAVTLIHPASWLSTMDARAPELIKYPVGDAQTGYFTRDHTERVASFISDKPGVTVIGPGIGRHPDTMTFVRELIGETDGPVIIDADALRALEDREDRNDKLRPDTLSGQILLTPHPGELAFLTGTSFADDSDRLRKTAELAERLGCTILSKGNPVFVHDPVEGHTILSSYDTSVFSRAGFGDTLAGHIAAFTSRTNDFPGSCENALLYGYQRIMEIKLRGKHFPEPGDLT